MRTLVINPRSDTDFVGLAEEQGRRAQSPAELQDALRTRFPRAVVRQRQLEGERGQVWYVYRDGVWVPSS